MENAIRAISNSNLTAEEKDALLRELANESIKKQQNENSFEAKRAKLVEKERQKAKETRERLEKYQKEAYRKEIVDISDREAQKYIEELAKVKNNQGEYIYKNLEQEYKNGKITKQEIYDLYEKVFYDKTEIYENVFKNIEENPVQKQEQEKQENEEQEKQENDEQEKQENDEQEDEIYGRIKVENNKIMPENDREQVRENIIRTEENIGEFLKVTQAPLTKDIKRASVKQISVSTSTLKEKIKNKLSSSMIKIKNKLAEIKEKRQEADNDLLEQIHNEAGFEIPQKELNSQGNQSFIPQEVNQNETEQNVLEQTPNVLEPENQSLENKNPAEMKEEENKSQADKISDIAGFEMPVNTFAENNKPFLEEEESQNPAEMKEEENKSQADNILDIAGLEMPVNTFNQGSSKNR